MMENVLIDWLISVLNMSITGAWTVLAVLILRAVLRHSPRKVLCWLWILPAFRLICPLSLPSTASLFNLLVLDAESAAGLTYIPRDIALAARPEISTGIPALNGAINGSLQAAEPLYSANPLQIWLAVAGMIWVLGMLALIGYALLADWRLRRKLRTAIRLEGNVWQADGVESPFVIGLIRPRIILPFGLSEEEMRCVLAHERAHIAHFDPIVKGIGWLILALHWFNPTVWLGWLAFGRDLELRCDEAVLAGGEEPAAYSRVLLALAGKKAFAPGPLAFGENPVAGRIKRALRWKKPALWLTVAAVLFCVLLWVLMGSNPADSKNSEEEPFGFTYSVEAVRYVALYSSQHYSPEIAPLYRLSVEGELFRRTVWGTEEDWKSVGFPVETVLTEENFDVHFLLSDLTDIASMRKDNARAWQAIDGHNAYILMEQKDGTLYLAECFTKNEAVYSVEVIYRLKKGDGICTLLGTESKNYAHAMFFPDGRFDFDYDALSTLHLPEGDVLELILQDESQSVEVGIDYYEYLSPTSSRIMKESFTLTREEGLTFPLICRNPGKGEHANVFILPERGGKYVIRVQFPTEFPAEE